MPDIFQEILLSESTSQGAPVRANITQVGTVEDLRALNGGRNDRVVHLLSYSTRGDFGDGFVYWDSSSTKPDDGGLTFKVEGISTGRWRRLYKEAVYATFWDYSTDPVSAINSALSNSVSDTIIIPDTGGISVSSKIIAQSNKTVYNYEEITTTASPAVEVDSVDKFLWSGGKIIGDGSTDGQECFVIEDSTNCSVKLCDIEDFLNKGVSIAGNSEYNYIYKVNASGATGTTGVGVSAFTTTGAYNKFESCVCNENRIGLSINGGKFNTIVNCIGNNNTLMGITFDGVVTASGDGCKYSTIINCVANENESSTYAGIYLGNGSNYNTISGCVAELNAGGGVRLTDSTNNKIVDCPSFRKNDVSGIMINLNSPDNSIENCSSHQNLQRGAIILGLNTKIKNCKLSNNIGHGLLVQSDYCLMDGNTVSNNGDKGIFNTTGGNFGFNNTIINNDVRGNVNENIDSFEAFIRNNRGWKTANKGVETQSGTATLDIYHGLDVRPRPEDIVITPLGEQASITQFWLFNVNNDFFQIKTETGSTVDIDWAWSVDVGNYVPY